MGQGYVYILTNSSFRDGYIKIGKTSKSPGERAKELSASTSIPSTFIVAYSHEFKDCNIAEREVHKKLSAYRINNDREFFNCSVDKAIQAINELLIEEYKRTIRELRETIKNNQNYIDDLKNNVKIAKYQWDRFFYRLNWNFTKCTEKLKSITKPDFILFTKDWSEDPYKEFGNKLYYIFERHTYIYIINNLPSTSNEINEHSLVKMIISEQEIVNERIRIVIVSTTPLKNNTSIWLGWQYSNIHQDWHLIEFIQHYDNKLPIFGLLDNDRSWFCMVRGELLQKENLFIDENELLEIWMKE